MSRTINYVKGSVLEPIGDGHKIIIHCCNDLGKMGSGVALALYKKWPTVKSTYLKWAERSSFKLGNVEFIGVEKDIDVGNMIGQHGIKNNMLNKPPVRYFALSKCLIRVCEVAKTKNATIHAPRFGSDRAGGRWDVIEDLIQGHLCDNNVDVTIYEL